ncbi:hypothetical protein SNE40_014939 [Patella caerulea]|uniref:Cysteine and tyrosine-rich protein 1 n=1 Tax=Patella caerulea TaxID=87958 RepID=A0AAN8JIY3_PATCE
MGTYVYYVNILYLGLITLITDSLCEICSYQTYDFDEWYQQYQTSTRYKYCTYGCCGVNLLDQYCCTVPIGLIIGCSVGAVFVVALGIILCICCCCVCGRAKRRRNGQVIRGPTVIFHTGQSNYPQQSTDASDVLNAPPPSYEEVMSGQDNYSFKNT